MKFVIDEEVKSLLPPHDERTAISLTAKLKAEGCRDRLTVGTYPGLAVPLLIDGHNRHAICRRLRVPYSVGKTIRFESRDALLQWVIDNQLARRNLTAEQLAYYRGKDYLHAKQPHGDISRFPSAQSEHLHGSPEKTAESVAGKHGVGQATIRRDAEFAAAVDEIGEREPEQKAAILNGTAGISRRQVIASVKPPRQKPKTPEEKKAAKDHADYFRGKKDDTAEHEFAELLNAVKALAVRISRAVNESEPGSRLREYLVYCNIVRPRDMVVDGKHYGWQCTYLRPPYRIINLAGKRRRLTREQVRAAFQEALRGEE